MPDQSETCWVCKVTIALLIFCRCVARFYGTKLDVCFPKSGHNY